MTGCGVSDCISSQIVIRYGDIVDYEPVTATIPPI